MADFAGATTSLVMGDPKTSTGYVSMEMPGIRSNLVISDGFSSSFVELMFGGDASYGLLGVDPPEMIRTFPVYPREV